MVTRGVKIVATIAILLVVGVALAIILPLVLRKTDNALIVGIVPHLDPGIVKLLQSANDADYNNFLENAGIGHIKDLISNLSNFVLSDKEGEEGLANYLEGIMEDDGEVIFFSEDSYKGDISNAFLGKSEDVDFPLIKPSAFITNGLDELDEDVDAFAAYKQAYPVTYATLEHVKRATEYPFGAVARSSEFNYKVDLDEMPYVGTFDHLISRSVLDIFKHKKMTVFDFSKAFESLESMDAVAFVKEMEFIFEFFLKTKSFKGRNVLLLPVKSNFVVKSDDGVDLNSIADIYHSFEKIVKDYGETADCVQLAQVYNVAELEGCVDGTALTEEYLHDLVKDNVGIYLEAAGDSENEIPIYGIGKKLEKLDPKTFTFADLGQSISELFSFNKKLGDPLAPEEPEVPSPEISLAFLGDTRAKLENECYVDSLPAIIPIGIDVEYTEEDVSLVCIKTDGEDTIFSTPFVFPYETVLELDVSSCDELSLLLENSDAEVDVNSVAVMRTALEGMPTEAIFGSSFDLKLSNPVCDDYISISIYKDDGESFEVSTKNLDEITLQTMDIVVEPISDVILGTDAYDVNTNSNVLVLEAFVFETSDHNRDWEVDISVQRLDSSTPIDATLRYLSGEDVYHIVLSEEAEFDSGVYGITFLPGLGIEFNVNVIDMLSVLSTTKDEISNVCVMGEEETIVSIEITTPDSIELDVVVRCFVGNDEDGHPIYKDETVVEFPNYDAVNMNIAGCKSIIAHLDGNEAISDSVDVKSLDVKYDSEVPTFGSVVNLELENTCDFDYYLETETLVIDELTGHVHANVLDSNEDVVFVKEIEMLPVTEITVDNLQLSDTFIGSLRIPQDSISISTVVAEDDPILNTIDSDIELDVEVLYSEDGVFDEVEPIMGKLLLFSDSNTDHSLEIDSFNFADGMYQIIFNEVLSSQFELQTLLAFTQETLDSLDDMCITDETETVPGIGVRVAEGITSDVLVNCMDLDGNLVYHESATYMDQHLPIPHPYTTTQTLPDTAESGNGFQRPRCRQIVAEFEEGSSATTLVNTRFMNVSAIDTGPITFGMTLELLLENTCKHTISYVQINGALIPEESINENILTYVVDEFVTELAIVLFDENDNPLLTKVLDVLPITSIDIEDLAIAPSDISGNTLYIPNDMFVISSEDPSDPSTPVISNIENNVFIEDMVATFTPNEVPEPIELVSAVLLKQTGNHELTINKAFTAGSYELNFGEIISTFELVIAEA